MTGDSAMTREPVANQAISRSDLARLEGYGDNCELGFVLRRLGFEDGMLFRWASIRPESLLATLREDFTNIYDFKNLVPCDQKMVRDLHYGTAWHTHMHSSVRAGMLAFEADTATRFSIHAREALKLTYLVEKLRRKFHHPNPVFVIKANGGISEDLLESIHYQTYRRATSPHFLLLEVRDDPERAGSVELLDRNRMRGYVSRFAPYDQADKGEDADWIAVLARALAHNADPSARPVSTLQEKAPQIIHLPFPVSAGPDLQAPIHGDLRAGMPSLNGGNQWCRMVDQDTYRLHAVGTGANATRLQWSGVHFPPGYKVTVRAGWAIEESMPVRATLEIAGAGGSVSRIQEYVFSTAGEQDFGLSADLPNPLIVRLSVESIMPLQGDDRAVIDVSSITAGPSVSTK